MNKIKLSLPNPTYDFFIKSYFLWFIVPYASIYIFTELVLLSLEKAGLVDSGRATLSHVVFGMYSVILGFIFGHILVLLIVGLGNKKLMSGGRVPKFNRFPRFTLFALSFLAYVVTTYAIGLFL